jgi:hypothetical protein
MTTFYGVVQNKRNGGYKYCRSTSRGGSPIGDCMNHDDHETAGEAQNCFNKWAREHIELREHKTSWVNCNIRECTNPAHNLAEVPYVEVLSVILCDEHFNKESAAIAMQLFVRDVFDDEEDGS